jgi:hypothetical protein
MTYLKQYKIILFYLKIINVFIYISAYYYFNYTIKVFFENKLK